MVNYFTFAKFTSRFFQFIQTDMFLLCRLFPLLLQQFCTQNCYTLNYERQKVVLEYVFIILAVKFT